MKNADIQLHVRGKSLFTGDLPVPANTLQAVVFPSPTAHGKVNRLDLSAAQRLPGVVRIFTAADIPGKNQIGNIIEDEPLLAEGDVHYIGQPMALIVAENLYAARKALRKITIDITPLEAVLEAEQAYSRGQFLASPRLIECGDVNSAWPKCACVVEGEIKSGAQEHLYLETQNALALPQDHGGLKIYSSTQSPAAGQRITAQVCGLPMHLVEIDVPRLGGGFGGKEDQATPWAALAGLAAHLLHRPVRLSLSRQEDMRMTGKRHPYTTNIKIGLDAEGRILAYQVRFLQNGGAAADLSTAVLDRSLLHATGSYYIPNVHISGYACKTNLPPNTAFRGFGAPQAFFAIESALRLAADKLNISVEDLQKKNLLKSGQTFPYGAVMMDDSAGKCWQKLEENHAVKASFESTELFNREHTWLKKGLAIVPICFGISFTNRFLNQASALVHIYADGSVNVSCGAVEMGQGVRAKMIRVAARTLGLSENLIRMESTQTGRIANMSPTAASSGADLNGHAVELACREIRGRLLHFWAEQLALPVEALEFRNGQLWQGEKHLGIEWPETVSKAWMKRIALSAHAHYATPGLTYDRETGLGSPFAYYVRGDAQTEVTLDALRGTYTVDAVRIVHEIGQSLDLIIDRGQVEGALMQGIGWMTMEELIWNDKGKYLADTLTTYKVPDIYSAPVLVETEFYSDDAPNPASMKSKAVGEPPFIYGLGAFFALRAAMKAFRDKDYPMVAPLTPERVLLSLYDQKGPGSKKEDGRKKTEERRRKKEDGRKKTEERRRKKEDGRKKTKDK